jgi:hypothetical protein
MVLALKPLDGVSSRLEGAQVTVRPDDGVVDVPEDKTRVTEADMDTFPWKNGAFCPPDANTVAFTLFP